MKLNLVVFGVTSNLAQIKLLPALYDLAKNNLLPDGFQMIGVSRGKFDSPSMDEYVYNALKQENRHHRHAIDDRVFRKLVSRINHLQGDINDSRLYAQLNHRMKSGNKMYYLATYPEFYDTIFKNLLSSGLAKQGKEWSRVVVEKPLGVDLASAKSLNKLLLRYFTEDQIYRLDHYLGKVTMQNILSFRFGNEMFEPLINRDYIDHIQITAIEDFGIGDRGSYYDRIGALKDVGQNHLIQMISLAAMDRPKALTNEAITQERIKLIKSLIPVPESLVLGQYLGYRNEVNVASQSATDTFFAFKAFLGNRKMHNVPVYFRAGKKLKHTICEIAVIFKLPDNRIFSQLDGGGVQNALIYRIQPNEGVALKILVNDTGHKKRMVPTFMRFGYKTLSDELTDPYERLLLDAINADQTFFNDAPEVEAQWEFIDKLSVKKPIPISYKQDSWGPNEADDLMKKDGRVWLNTPLEL